MGETKVSETKYCPKCKQEKPADTVNFYNDKKSATGLSSWCRECQRASVNSKNSEKMKKESPVPEEKTPAGDGLVHVPADDAHPEGWELAAGPASSGRVLVLDFTEHEDWHDDLLSEAAGNLRTNEMQAMWLITQALYQERKTI